MKHTKTLFGVAAASPLLLALELPADEVRFAPAEGAVVTKVFTNESEMTIDDMTLFMNGEDMTEMAAMDMTMFTVMTTVVTDQYASMRDGGPAKLVRTYDELSSDGTVNIEHPMMGEQEVEVVGSSELTGRTVAFTWDGETEEYGVAFADDGDDEPELLEGLEENMDLRVLLPGKAVSEGDSWRVDLEEVVGLFAPGGDLKIQPEDMEAMGGMGMGNESMSMSDMAAMFGEMQGSVLATYQGSSDGIGTIALTVDVRGANDVTDILQESMEDMDSPMGDMEVVYDAADVEFSIQGEGELMWNLAAGHLHAFEFEGDMEMAMDMAMAMSMMGSDMEMEVSMEMSGSLKIGAQTRSGE